MKMMRIAMPVAFIAIGIIASIFIELDGYGSFERQMVMLGYFQVAWLMFISFDIEGGGR